MTDTSNSLPILKAIIPKAKSPIKDNFSIIILFSRLKPDTPSTNPAMI